MRGGIIIARHSFCRQCKLHGVTGRIDYIEDEKKQERLYATYSTTDDKDFWEKLAEENRREFEKYRCEGQCVEAREWIIALEESLVQEEPQKVIRAFVDAFKEKYGVECTAALHHNRSMTNYHIHMIFADRKLLPEPVVKVASRRMYFDEQGRHRRTKKEVCDSSGNLREGCSVIEKGAIYEKTIFSGKVEYFKEKAFQQEAKELFTEINNSFIKDEARKLRVFDRNSVYLATKKIGKNNPKEGAIKEDNRIRQEWNRAADVALVSGADEGRIIAIRREHISEPVRASIADNGTRPELLAEIVRNAVKLLQNLIEQSKVPKKPKCAVDMKEFQEMGRVMDSLEETRVQIGKLDRRIKAKQTYMDKLTYPWKKIKALKELSELVNRRTEAETRLTKTVKEAGYPNVQCFMATYQKSLAAVQKYEREYAVYRDAVEREEVVDPDVKVSIRRQLKKFQEEGRQSETSRLEKCRQRDVWRD